MATEKQIKEFTTSAEMLEWQYFQIIGEMQELQRHESDPRCPCRLSTDLGENCLAKHSLGLSVLAAETAAMDENHKDLLDSLSMEAKEKHEQIKAAVCGKGDAPEITKWSRQWRKVFEPIYYTCKVSKKAHLHDVEASLADPGAVKISGKCDSGSCAIKVTSTRKVEASTSSIKNLDKVIQDVEKRAESQSKQAIVTNRTFAIGANGTRYEFEFRIADAESLVVSNDPFTFEPNKNYPQELQPRLRGRAANRLQVENIAANLDPDTLLTDYHSIDRGAPIIKDMVVESGNGRVMAIVLSSHNHPEVYAKYKARLKELAPSLGIPAGDVGKYGTPILVRERITKVDRKQFVEEANSSATIESSAIEKARTDAEKITPEMISSLGVLDGEAIEDALRSSRNKPFVTAFLNKLSSNEQAKLVDSSGAINQDGLRRMAAALFVATFRGDIGIRLAEKFFESTDVNVRNIFNGLTRSLGVLAQAESLTGSGQRRAEYALGEDLAKVISVYSNIKKTPGMTVDKYINQASMLDRELNSFQERMLSILDNNSRSARRIAGILNKYAELVISSPSPNQVSLIPGETVTKLELFERAVRGSQLALVEDIIKLQDTCQRTPAKYSYLTGLFIDDPAGMEYDLSDVATAKESKLDEVLERLESGVKSIQESSNFLEFMKTMSRFHEYSLGNIILIMLQKSDASRVAGFNTWKDLGRYVKKGEHGISILAPCWNTRPRKVKVIEKDPDTGEDVEVEKTIHPAEPDAKYFKVVSVFDYSQTDGKELPRVEVPVLQGDGTKPIFDKALQYANSLGIQVQINDSPESPVSASTMGYWSKMMQTIWVRSNVPQDQQTKTILHEIAHAMCEMRGSRDAETMAESVAYTVADHFGFDTGARSFPYVAVWSEDIKILKANLEVIRKVSGDMIAGIEKIATMSDPELSKVADALNNIETVPVAIAALGDVRECGYTVCVDNKGNISRGSSACGTESNVSIPVACSCKSQKPIAIVHNHPSEIPYPSAMDRETARKLGVNICVETKDGIRCFRPDAN